MPYSPTYPPSNQEDLTRWLAEELTRINPDILEGQEYFSFTPLSVEPSRPTIGEIKWADGTNWNPGAGMGLYEYTDLGWSKLGAGNGNVVPTSHSVLQDLLADDHPQYHNDVRGDARYYTQPQIDANHYTRSQIDARVVNDLADVTASLPIDGEVLTWSTGLSKWVSATSTGSGGGIPTTCFPFYTESNIKDQIDSSSELFPFYTSTGVLDTISTTGDIFPFYTALNIFDEIFLEACESNNTRDTMFRQPTEPQSGLLDGDTWYNTSTFAFSVYRNNIWEPLTYHGELAGDGALLVNGGNF